MSPTIFRSRGYRFYFFSREEARCTFILTTRPARPSSGLNRRLPLHRSTGWAPRLAAALRLVKEHADEIRTAWQTHFGR
jgi:hypothetical protein